MNGPWLEVYEQDKEIQLDTSNTDDVFEIYWKRQRRIDVLVRAKQPITLRMIEV